MITTCGKCGKKYRINPAKIVKEKVKFICSNCGSPVWVKKTADSKKNNIPSKLSSDSTPPEDVPSSPSTDSASINTISSPQPTDAASTEKQPPSSPPPPLAMEDITPPPLVDPIFTGKELVPVATPQKLKLKGFSIRSKLILIIVGLVSCSLFVSGYMASQKIQSVLARQAKKQLQHSANLKSKEYSLIFKRIREEVEGIATYAQKVYTLPRINQDLDMKILMPWDGEKYGNPTLEKTLKEEITVLQQIGIVLKGLVSHNSFLSLGYYGTESGLTVFNDQKVVDVVSELDAFKVTRRPWYITAKKKKGLIWTKPYVDANTKKLVVTCAMPVSLPDTRIVGVVGFDVLLDTIQKDILQLEQGPNSYAFLIDANAAALVRPDMNAKDARWDTTYKSENLLKTDNKAFNRIIQKMVDQESGFSEYPTDENVKYISYAPVKAIEASLAIVTNKDEIMGPAIEIRNLIAGIFIVVLIIAIAIGFVIGNNITRPINELTHHANLISMGKSNLDVLNSDRKDEIGVLTQAFNRLIISLKLVMSRM